ncbi:hypothetical protein RND71_003604 [Anisodus tanguticus]|uniref:Uncharacterized protein n=1 Tax=Anisodus tanguticus TaxID=243964 RepID=A0AAE1STJ8_9SOLA|nr:hypothetical protein RND71_003604 [Anisodus tanguticus]
MLLFSPSCISAPPSTTSRIRPSPFPWQLEEAAAPLLCGETAYQISKLELPRHRSRRPNLISFSKTTYGYGKDVKTSGIADLSCFAEFLFTVDSYGSRGVKRNLDLRKLENLFTIILGRPSGFVAAILELLATVNA